MSPSSASASARAVHAKRAAERAVEFLRPGMVVGLGGGTTVLFALRKLASLLRAGELHDLLGVSCSTATSDEARRLGVPLTTLADHPVIDVTIDGADEVDPDFNLIKGGGGALLHEKIVAQASRRELIVVEHGLFLGFATDLIVAGDGGIRHLERQRHRSDDPPGERR